MGEKTTKTEKKKERGKEKGEETGRWRVSACISIPPLAEEVFSSLEKNLGKKFGICYTQEN